MKTILYMAMTVNGYIARSDDETPWSQEEWTAYAHVVKQLGNVIVGKRTYTLMKAENEFKRIGNPFTMVVAHPQRKADGAKINFVSSPRKALKILEEKGFKKALIGGGSKLNASFLKEGLIDEIWLDVEPLIFGKGIKLFTEVDAEAKLELLRVKNISKNVLRVKYKIVRQKLKGE